MPPSAAIAAEVANAAVDNSAAAKVILIKYFIDMPLYFLSPLFLTRNVVVQRGVDYRMLGCVTTDPISTLMLMCGCILSFARRNEFLSLGCFKHKIELRFFVISLCFIRI
jgi:hypothetical protein